MTESPGRMADHWWYRPGWAPGARFYTWHLTFQDAPEVHRLAAAYRTALSRVPDLDLVPDRWLHLTMQGLGFTRDVTAADARAIADAAGRRLAAVPAFDLGLGRPTITPEAIRWDPPAPGPGAVRAAIRQAIGDVWADVPEPAGGFTSHVTIAYSRGDGPARPVRDALDGAVGSPATARVTHADLIILGRDTDPGTGRPAYTWETFASAPLGD